MKNYLTDTTFKLADTVAQWQDSVIKAHVPQWKLRLLLRFNKPWLRRLIRANVEIERYDLIADFGTQYVIRLNGRVIGERKVSYTEAMVKL